jgi:DNA-binding IclR family transcriptional regulator
VHRTVELLDFLRARGAPATGPEIVQALGIPKSSAYELIRTLAGAGLIEEDAGSGRYYLGRRLYVLGLAYRAQVDLMREGTAAVRALRDETGETVQFSVLDDRHMLVLVKEEGVHALRIISTAGSRVPVNWAAAGRFLVSDLDDAALRALLAETVRPSPTGRAETDIDRLVARIRAARRDGFATEINEVNAHAGCVAAPVLDEAGRCVAALSIAVPEPRLTPERLPVLIAAVTGAARRLSERLGAG